MFEATVKLAKRCLRTTLRNASLRYKELETILIEKGCILKSHPFTFLCDDISESPLTPSCLIKGRRFLDKLRITPDNANSDRFRLPNNGEVRGPALPAWQD